MKTTIVTGPDSVEVREAEQPPAGDTDVLVRVKACGICGTDTAYIHMGGTPLQQGDLPIGHEIAGEVIEVGSAVDGVSVGDHVVVNPMATSDGIIGNGGAQGGLSEVLVLRDAEPGSHFRVVPSDIPWHVLALNEPMAVAYHGVNRSGAGAGSKAVVFGAGPIGLGAAIGLKSKGAAHVVVVDVVPGRLDKALKVGADAVINSAEEDVISRLKELHGEVPQLLGDAKPGTDVYIDAAGVPAVITTAFAAVKHGATITVIALHKKPVEIDLQSALMSEVDLRFSMGYPTEIFEVTDSIIENVDRYAVIPSDLVPYSQVLQGLELAATPGATDKVVITFD
ncbi:zinc-dependent alcohol dehydrogenase [Streptomyces sp. NPDC002643]